MKSLRSDVFRSIMLTVSISILAWGVPFFAVGTVTSQNPWGALQLTSGPFWDIISVDSSGRPHVDTGSWHLKWVKRYNSGLWYVIRTELGHMISFNAPSWAKKYEIFEPIEGIGAANIYDMHDANRPVIFEVDRINDQKIGFILGGVSNKFSIFVLSGLLRYFPRMAGPFMLVSLLFAFVASRLVMAKLNKPLNALSAKLSTVAPNQTLELIGADDTPRELIPLLDRFNETLALLHTAHADQRQFAAELAHELRTPIAAVMARLQHFTPSGERQSMLERLAQLHGLVGQLLDNERLRWGDEMRAEIDLIQTARVVAAELGPLVVGARRTITLKQEGAAIIVYTDGTAVSRVLNNLIANAIVHGAGEISVHVKTDLVAQKVVLRVSDEGSAIRNEDIQTMLQPYRKGEGNGSGLGLSISMNIMKKLGGDLVGKVTDAGTEFSMILPMN